MDRLFLAGLVREIDASVTGARVRSLRIDPDSQTLTLTLTLTLNKPGAPAELVIHIGAQASGLFMRETGSKPGRASAREAKLEKLIASATITSVVMSPLDRVVTVNLEQTRLSGKTRRVALVLELVAARTSLFILNLVNPVDGDAIDLDASSIVDHLSTGTARLSTGESYRALEPPPHASTPAQSTDELERRLEEAGRPPAQTVKTAKTNRTELLSATGWTPLLVREMQFAMNVSGASPGAAFADLHDRLQAARPVLYVDPGRPSKVLLSPITLTSETTLEPHSLSSLTSFNDAMAEAVRLTVDAERSNALRQRLVSAISRRLKSLVSLKRKLEKQRDQLPAPAELRRRGETLLSALLRAERIDDTHVRLPDPFHPDAHLVDIEIDPRLGLPENAERLFRRSRKAERTELELGRRLEALGQQLTFAEEARVNLEGASTLEELEPIRDELEDENLLPAPKRGTQPRGQAKRLPPRRFDTARGNTILVGRSARSNAELTFHLAKPDDLWLHASGIPGSHVVLKCSGSMVADDEEIAAAAGYAAWFSKGRNDTYVDVVVTPRRNVSAIKGAPPGLVRVANVETVRVRPTPPPVESDAPAEVG